MSKLYFLNTNHKIVTPMGHLLFLLVSWVQIFVFVTSEGQNLTLDNTSPTNWGSWGDWDRCPPDTYVSAFQLKVQSRQWRGDDTALNAIKLFCSSFSEPVAHVMSYEGTWGDWGNVYTCTNGYLTGFQLRSESDLGWRQDDTAANNLLMFCSNPSIGYYTGDGMSWGSWGSEMKCLAKQAICGIKTQVAGRQVILDDVALNNVHMECCPVKSPAESCTPTDSWNLVTECDNTQGAKPTVCKFTKKLGLEFTSTSKDNKQEERFAKLGFNINELGLSLAEKFEHNFNTSRTGHDWSSDVADTWKEQKSIESKFNVEANKLARVFQVVGRCGILSVYTAQYKMEAADTPFKK